METDNREGDAHESINIWQREAQPEDPGDDQDLDPEDRSLWEIELETLLARKAPRGSMT